ncbi:MAG: thioredoxin [Chitinophagaceae bacterium]|nr:MAG: thioredoxin [Chitinophagaceae bacterium]
MSAFQDIIQSGKLVLIDFSAEWCGPCKMMAPVLKEVKDHIGDNVTILKVDVDRNPAAARAYEVQGVPTLVLIRSGKTLWRQSGAMPAHQLTQVIQQHI